MSEWAALLSLARNRQVPDANRLTLTMGELREVLAEAKTAMLTDELPEQIGVGNLTNGEDGRFHCRGCDGHDS